MSMDPPTPRTGTVPRRAGVIPPIIKLLSCGWHPRATRGTSLASTLLSASFAIFSVYSLLFSSLLLSPLYSSIPFPFLSLFLAPSFHLPPSCSIRPLVDPRWFADWMLRTFAAKDHRSFLADRDYFKLINPSPVFGLGLQCFVVERFRHSTVIQRIIIGIILPVISFWKISSSY